MIIEKVESSQINQIAFDADSNRLFVEFKKGAVYQYQNVNDELFLGLKSADSVGKFFNDNIRKKPLDFPFDRMDSKDSPFNN